LIKYWFAALRITREEETQAPPLVRQQRRKGSMPMLLRFASPDMDMNGPEKDR
jgi:hypothetical protein